MRNLETLNQDIDRCQAQIAAIFDLPLSEQCEITLQGFQIQLKYLLNERERINAKAPKATIVLFNQSGCFSKEYASELKQRAFQTHNCTIQQTKQL